jgi:D-threonate/D-erythronate kinase
MQHSPLETQQPEEHREAAGPVFILADDLTGACDSGVAFLAAGRSVRVVLDPVVLDPASLDRTIPPKDSVLAITTESRTLAQHEAAEQVARTTLFLLSRANAPTLFKKIDSAARGHIGAETIAALDASGAVIAIVAPAFPAAGRTVLNGVLTIRDAANQDITVSLRDLFLNTDPTQIAVLPTTPTPALEQGIAQAIASGIRILLCDAQIQSDLEHLAAAAFRHPHSILWTGSAGLAHALAATLPHLHQAKPIAPGCTGRTLLFVGTDHPVTTLQISHLEADPGTPPHSIHRVDWTTPSPRDIQVAFASVPTSALILTGGETAAFVLRALDASGILLAGELAPGIPWGVLEGGAADGCMVVTKSGGFGPCDALVQTFAFCKQICTGRACAPA